MSFTGSDILEVTFNNAEKGQGTFYCKAGETYSIDLGGIRSTDDTGMVTGSGVIIDQKTVVRSKFTLGPIAWDKTSKDEVAVLVSLAETKVGTTFTVSCIDGAIYQMQNGFPVGDIDGDGYAAGVTVALQGNANAKQIA